MNTVVELEKYSLKLRRDIVRMIGFNNGGHFGGACSIADVIAALYFYKMKHDPQNPSMPERDRIVFSKGHAAVVQYAALAEAGYFPISELWAFKELGSMLQGHPDYRKTPGIECGTGSLGQGLSIACGMAAAGKMDGKDYCVYCIVGDGEMNEGQIWEAAQAAHHYKLDNLVAILDSNGLCGTGFIADRFNAAPWDKKWEAFGWDVAVMDGHDMASIVGTLDQVDIHNGKPTMIIAKTVKGKGVPVAENNPLFHNGSITKEQYDELMCAFEKAMQ